MQLVAYGAQDIYLTGNPQITFFKVVYRRHTNFSVESIEQTFNGTADFGKKVSATIARNGDLIHRVLLEVNLAEVTGEVDYTYRWVAWLGEKMLKYIDIEIGGQRIDRHYGEWLHIWSQLTLTSGQEKAYKYMVGHEPTTLTPVSNTPTETIPAKTLYIPLQFWFCRNPGLALPLIALQYHEVKINIEFNDLSDCLIYYNYNSSSQEDFSQQSIPTTISTIMESASLWVDYIYLDTDERRRFAQLSHEYLIEQLQYPGEETISVTSNKIKLPFNHPVKQLIWVVQRQDNIDAKQAFNYTTSYDSTILSQDANIGNESLHLVKNSLSTDSNENTLEFMNSREDSGSNCCSIAKLQLNGQDRFAERGGDYFNYVQPYYHHTRTPAPGINTYSFAIKPEEHQPSGTCNFSRIDNANLFITVESAALYSASPIILADSSTIIENNVDTPTTTNAKVRIYAVNYNVLRIMSGMGGLAYSN